MAASRLVRLAALVLVLAAAACSSRGSEGGASGVTPSTRGGSAVSTVLATTTTSVEPGRYAERIFPVVEEHLDVEYATAPDLLTGAEVRLALDWFEPAGDALPARPAIVWIHGGGFASGNRGVLRDIARQWAERGYVTASISYRLDPGNRCTSFSSLAGEERAREVERCLLAMSAAQHDAQGAVRWLRANATELRIDPDRIAVGGFSAGAMTAVHVAQRSEEPGEVGDNDGESPTVGAALAASGCNVEVTSIDATDAPIHLLASELDRLVPFRCVEATEQRTREVGVDVETMYFLADGTHARALYLAHQAQVDAAWSRFLVEHLDLG